MPSPTRSVSEYAADALAMLTKPVKYTVRSKTDSSPFQQRRVSSQTRSAILAGAGARLGAILQRNSPSTTLAGKLNCFTQLRVSTRACRP